MKTYKSKIDAWLVIFVFGLTAVSIVPISFLPVSWLGIVLAIICVVLILDIFCNTKYTIKGNELYVQCGTFFRFHYDINTIRGISRTNTIASSPALSTDRIRIVFNNSSELVISPKHKKEFIEDIMNINPNIILK